MKYLAIPFDFIKTQCQKEEYIDEKTLKLFKKFYKEQGLLSLYTGWQFKSVQYFLQALLTVKTLDYLENKAKRLKDFS